MVIGFKSVVQRKLLGILGLFLYAKIPLPGPVAAVRLR
jgi:hypothetical protein